MNLVFLVVLAYILKTATFVSSKPQLQVTFPARARFARGADLILEDLPLDEETLQSKPDNSVRLQEALSALLALNDGELKSLLMGVPVGTVAENLSAQATFLLRASRNRLLKLQSVLTANKPVRDDFRIAKRKKKTLYREAKSETDIIGNIELYESNAKEADSLLSALSDLTQHIEEQQKIFENNEEQARIIRSHQTNNKRYHSSKMSKKTHFSYWLKPEECQSSPDGTPRIYCPNPRHGGQWVCIEESDLCDGHSHCPDHEDEDPHSCMFYKGLKTQLDVLVGGLLHISSRRS